jgi:DNA-binding beta-propeller fold protein YncE
MANIDITAPAAPETTPALGEGDIATPSRKMRGRRSKVAALVAFLIVLALLFAWYLMNRKPLSELPGLSSAKLPHYELSIYGAARPLGVAANANGDRIYVTESDGKRLVKVYDRAGKQTGTLQPPKSTGVSHTPIYVAVNPTTQDVYVTDRFTASIYIYDASGKYLRTFAPKGNLGGKFAPLAITFAPDGTLYATDIRGKDASNHRVVSFTPEGNVLKSMGKPGQLNFPNGIAVDPQGNIQVADSSNGRMVIFTKFGKMLATVSRGIGEGDLGLPKGAAIDDSGRLFVADTTDHQVRMYMVDKSKTIPTYVGSFGSEGQRDGQFEYPNGVATDKRAHIYVTDRENNRVQVWGY